MRMVSTVPTHTGEEGEHLLYVGNYLPHEHEYYKKEAVDLIKDFYPYLQLKMIHL